MGLISYDPLSTAGGGAFDADANTLITPSTPIVLDQATGDEAALTLDYTTNKAAGNDTGLLINQTDTASPGTSNLLDLQVGGTSRVKASESGVVINSLALAPQYVAKSLLSPSRVGHSFAFRDGVPCVTNGTGYSVVEFQNGIRVRSNSALEFSSSSTSAHAAADTTLARDAANTLAQRNGVNAQTFNIYNTYTDATNYERAHIGWNDTADTLVIGTEAGSGGGTQRPIQLNANGARKFYVGLYYVQADVRLQAKASLKVEGGITLGPQFASATSVQTIKAHDTLTGTGIGGDLSLSGGAGSVADGNVILEGNVGIGTATPNALLSLGAAANAQQLLLHENGNARYGLGIQSGEMRIFSRSTAAVGVTIGAIDNSDGSTYSENVRFEPGGNVGIGTTTPTVALDVSGSIAATGTIKATPTTVGALPAAATAGAGARTFVTDSDNSLSSHHGQTVIGGGSNFVPVYSDGTNWIVG